MLYPKKKKRKKKGGRGVSDGDLVITHMGLDIDISRSSSTKAVLGWGHGIIKLKAVDLWSHPGLLSGCLLRPFTVTFK